MALIQQSVFLGVADRLAKQFSLIKTAFDSINTTGGGLYYTRLTATEDSDVELKTLSAAQTADTSTTITQGMSGMSGMKGIITSMDSHFTQVSSAGSWSGYCTTKDIRVSDYTNQVYFSAKGSYMLSNAVFAQTEQTFGTGEVTSGPALTFTDGVTFGTGAVTNLADGSNFAATQLKAQVTVVGGAGPGMAADLDLTISLKDPDNVATTKDIVIPAGSIVGDEVDLGLTTDRYLDITGIAFTPASDQGTVGDEIIMLNVIERVVAF